MGVIAVLAGCLVCLLQLRDDGEMFFPCHVVSFPAARPALFSRGGLTFKLLLRYNRYVLCLALCLALCGWRRAFLFALYLDCQLDFNEHRQHLKFSVWLFRVVSSFPLGMA